MTMLCEESTWSSNINVLIFWYETCMIFHTNETIRTVNTWGTRVRYENKNPTSVFILYIHFLM